MSVNGSESRKNVWDGIRWNKSYIICDIVLSTNNSGQSAAKHESEGSTTRAIARTL